MPEALASGNLDLRTHCRVVRVLVDVDGHADGVEYLDPAGELRVQRARTVILASYTYENLRLMFLSGGLGDASGQLGRHYMTKFWSDVYGHVPGAVFNGHTGPAAQMCGIDDYQQEAFDSFGARVRRRRDVQHREPEAAPRHRARPGAAGRPALGGAVQGPPAPLAERRRHPHPARRAPVHAPTTSTSTRCGATPAGSACPSPASPAACDRTRTGWSGWMQARAAELLRAMGAASTWPTARFKGVLSSHDLGGRADG